MSTIEQLKNIFVEYTGNDVEGFSEETVLSVDMVMNSFEIFGLICEIEEHFDIEIPENDAFNFDTVGDVIKYLENNVD